MTEDRKEYRMGKELMMLTDADGTIIAAAAVQSDATSDDGPRFQIEPLRGQKLHKVQLPTELVGIAADASFGITIDGARIDDRTGNLVLAHEVKPKKERDPGTSG